MAGGFYLALLLLFNSHHWLWELNDTFPVKPVAAMLQEQIPPQQKIYTNYPHIRPSLEFYSDRVILPRSNQELQELWQSRSIYLLIDKDALSDLDLKSPAVIGSSGTWQLLKKSSSGK